MDKGFRQGRVAIAILAVALLVLALPTLAFAATFGAPYPAGTVHTAPQLIGVNVFSSSPLDVRTAAITIDGVSQHVAVTGQGSASGDWSVTEMLQTDGSYKIHWTWTASAADSTEAQLTCAPASPLSNGTHHVVATIGADSVAWDMNVQVTAITPVTPPSVTATAVVGCACHPGFQIGHHGDADCNSCHSGADLPAHGSPITGEKGSFSHSIMPVASMDTTNQACVASGCHSTDLVTTHDHAACASCHTSAPYNAVADTCVCHGDAGARPTGDLAHNIAAAVANSGATLECTTCHNTPNHMGHTVANYYTVGSGLSSTAATSAAGEPNYHKAPGALSSACVACHGSDLPTVHSGNPSYGGVAPGCVCHTGYFVADINKVGIGNTPDCPICHTGGYAAHGFNGTDTHGVYATASGHNTTVYGVVGGKSMFDGSQGVTLTTVGGAVVSSTWATPTANVFNPNATDDQGQPLGWNSVITCQDCHSGLNQAGPHGAADNWGIDPNYPYPYSLAINSHYSESGIAARVDATTFVSTQVSVNPRIPAFTGSLSTTAIPAAYAAAGLHDASGQNNGVSGNQYAVICAKCHKLFDFDNAYTVGNYSAGSHGFTFTNATGIGNDSNTPHASHHWDLNNGAADCVSCHVAIPHGWKRPRLLINSYNGTYTVNASGTTQTVTSVADAQPYLQSGARFMTPTSGPNLTPRGMGPLSSTDQHTLSAGTTGGALWTESNCIACSNGSGLEHTGVPTDGDKLK